ncbi:MAG TPA: ABC transporter permease, partial [Bacillota bacterium]|nr:ABC transporter permease [Bacillota bacterium]
MSRSYFLRKLFFALITVSAILVINYFLFRVMPGDPVSMLVRNPKMSPEAVQKVRELFGLNKPWYEQFTIYIINLLKGDMGISFIYRKPVSDIIIERLAASLALTIIAELIAIGIGLFLGIIAAWKRGKRVDMLSMGFSLITYAMPTFWLGVLMIALFSVNLRLFPTSGMISPEYVFTKGLIRLKNIGWHIFLPAITLSLVLIGEYMLVMRSTLIEVLTEDYIVTAEAKGMDKKSVLKRHALPNAMIPMVTLISMNLGFTITGALQVETVFSWPGLGRLMYDALQARDYPLLQGIFLIISLCVVGANFISDIMYGYLDPR